ncbi:tRNA (adenosine(37)-N6)-threonylcarbamoyltransferase complex dimerization subunit type 1 TsaB [Maritimibacter alkaliphilus]|uniref:tRNA (adenosine(37)-N6)-threonylcarbamoyltransferase complex dimerization subunit type 1 TsaB n=1 Tax=Maritimibacter alkaliphilus TaxID=404236 RepID=UPI001C964805|nr:tRNA (adenosine(37)-N6)-threonylcarbamoyltransferase complex dimerization subunit type 1 TsaB [Maritimibacter alkaliphilus]MBY6091259.1 tRNA (adenosine(37)-N6)-threonylcarbamoyltransferase complex dimerization subunit type 1 TsaB [Maritimibacter alkaliphilus]
MSDLLTLGFDTSAAHCAAALLRGDTLLVSRAEEMTRGQAERLFPLLEEVLAEGGVTWAELDRIGVGVGPGNFTGIRISVSAARGLALSLDIPAVGVSTFEAIALLAPGRTAAVPAPRDHLYVLAPGGTPELLPAAEAGDPALPPAGPTLAEAIARVAAQAGTEGLTAPAPLYLKPADAAPPRDPAPRILDDA